MKYVECENILQVVGFETTIKQVWNKAKGEGWRGEMIVDMLPSLGTSFNRFVRIDLDAEKLKTKIYAASNEEKRKSNKFYQNNQEMLRDTVLTNYQKFAIRKGRCI